MSDVLLATDDPDSSTRMEYDLPEIPRFFLPDIIRPVVGQLLGTTMQTGRAYLYGGGVGVGSSILAARWARALSRQVDPSQNTTAARMITFTHEEASGRERFVSTLAAALGIPFHPLQLRMVTTSQLVARLHADLHQMGVRCLIFDHVERATRRELRGLVDLMMATDQHYGDAEPDTRSPLRVGIILVSPELPSVALKGCAELASLLAARGMIEMRAYDSIAEVAEIMKRIPLGLHDLDITTKGDRLMADIVLRDTRGRAVLMEGVFRHAALLAGSRRPTAEDIAGASVVTREFRTILFRDQGTPAKDLVPARMGGVRQEESRPAVPAAQRTAAPASASSDGANPDEVSPVASGAAPPKRKPNEKQAKKRAGTKQAEAERKRALGPTRRR